MKKNINEYLVYGINNAISLFSSKRYTINSIILIKGGMAETHPLISSMINNKKNLITFFEKKEFYQKYDFKHTQGILVSFTAKLILDFQDVTFIDDNMCYVIIDQINDPQNLGQILRTCECAGVNGIILPKHGSVHITNSVLQVSQGAFTNVNIFIVTNIRDTINHLKNNKFWIIGVENSLKSDVWYKMDYSKKVCLVFGSEGKGIRPLVKKSCDFLATIPMNGKINSLNVTAALSAILFERQRQIISN